MNICKPNLAYIFYKNSFKNWIKINVKKPCPTKLHVLIKSNKNVPKMCKFQIFVIRNLCNQYL
jgi:hypothetical protein